MENKELSIKKINDEVELQLQDHQVLQTLVDTTFKGLEPENIKRAMVEGMIRGFTFKDFLEKKVYALPFKDNYSGKQAYSLITSIDFARRIGSRSGIVGKDKPVFEVAENGAIVSCTVTVHKRQPDGYIGEFTAEVYFSEYAKVNYKTGEPEGLWKSKPRTMLAKVGEMHALRQACPEELAQTYSEEEMEQETLSAKPVGPVLAHDIGEYEAQLRNATSLDEMRSIWAPFPIEVKKQLEGIKDEMKATFEKNEPQK